MVSEIKAILIKAGSQEAITARNKLKGWGNKYDRATKDEVKAQGQKEVARGHCLELLDHLGSNKEEFPMVRIMRVEKGGKIALEDAKEVVTAEQLAEITKRVVDTSLIPEDILEAAMVTVIDVPKAKKKLSEDVVKSLISGTTTTLIVNPTRQLGEKK